MKKELNKVIGDITDCRTEEGITVSLIDTISFLLGQLSHRNLESANVKEAIKDFQVNGKFNIGAKVYTLFISEKGAEKPSFENGKRVYPADERERCSNCKRRIEANEKVFRASDYPPTSFGDKKKTKQHYIVAEFNKFNNAVYCPDCTEKFDKVLSKIK